LRLGVLAHHVQCALQCGRADHEPVGHAGGC
jgi:hypothetical protein